jgi:Ca2+/H+ antiporter
MRTLERARSARSCALRGSPPARTTRLGDAAAFVIATLALAGLAWIVSLATEQVGEHIGPAATGLLQASVGNLPELFVVLFALHAGERVVAQSAIVGSLFANALLVLGLVLIVGALRAPGGVMRFHPKVTRATRRRCCSLRLHHRHRRPLAVESGAVARTTSRRSRPPRRCCC